MYKNENLVHTKIICALFGTKVPTTTALVPVFLPFFMCKWFFIELLKPLNKHHPPPPKKVFTSLFLHNPNSTNTISKLLTFKWMEKLHAFWLKSHRQLILRVFISTFTGKLINLLERNFSDFWGLNNFGLISFLH